MAWAELSVESKETLKLAEILSLIEIMFEFSQGRLSNEAKTL